MNTTSRLPVSQPEASRLSAYLTGALGTAALLGASQADAAVTSVTFAFTELNASSGIGSTSVGSFGNLAFYASNYTYDGSTYVALGLTSYGAVYHDAADGPQFGLPTFFGAGVLIGNTLNGAIGRAYFRGFGASFDLPTSEINRNIGFVTTTSNYGWANVSWNNDTAVLTINSVYVESVVGAPITVGDTGAVPEPAASAALLALAGLGVAATRRRPRPLAA